MSWSGHQIGELFQGLVDDPFASFRGARCEGRFCGSGVVIESGTRILAQDKITKRCHLSENIMEKPRSDKVCPFPVRSSWQRCQNPIATGRFAPTLTELLPVAISIEPESEDKG
jgi:hypothetical protein